MSRGRRGRPPLKGGARSRFDDGSLLVKKFDGETKEFVRVRAEADDFLELSKPREERHHGEFYPDLSENKPLPVLIIEGVEQTRPNLPDQNASNYREQQQRVDTQILSRLKKPSFRPIIQDNIDNDSNTQLKKQYLQLGYNDSRNHRKPSETYLRSNSVENGLIKNLLSYNDKFQVLYDMDEQDGLFVDHINTERMQNNYSSISYELFEIIITFLEVQWYFVEKLLPPRPKNQYISDERAMIQASIYGSDDGTGAAPEEDQCCAVCNKNECDALNAIVFCEGCDIAVHQECYGVAFIPEGPWLCRRCLTSRNQHNRCLFCPSTTGAFKQTDNGYWGHVICTLWINELYFANPIYMEPIEGIQNIPKSRWKLTCYICRQRVGACVQCRKNSCSTAYHATCARRADLYMELKNGIQGAINDKSSVISYCDKHSPKGWSLNHDTKLGIKKTRLYYSSARNSKLPKLSNRILISRQKKKELKGTRNDLFKWKTAAGSPIAPNVFITYFQEFMEREKIFIEDDQNLFIQICQYWTLKRDLKRAPLIKRLDATNFGGLTDEEIDERMNILGFIKSDVSKLIDISETALQKAQVNLESTENLIDQINMFYLPMQFLVNELFEHLVKHDKHGVIRTVTIDDKSVLSIEAIEQRVKSHRYESVSQLIKDISVLDEYVVSSGQFDRNSAIYKHFKNYWRRTRTQVFERMSGLERMVQNGEMQSVLDHFKLEGLEIQERDDDEVNDDENDDGEVPKQVKRKRPPIIQKEHHTRSKIEMGGANGANGANGTNGTNGKVNKPVRRKRRRW